MRKVIQKIVFFLFAGVLCLTSLVVNVQAESWSWTKVADNVNLQSVDMVNSNDGWAVGSEGTIVHWDGVRWNSVDSPTNADLRAVDVVSSTEVYAIAFALTIPINESLIRWDGASWKNVTSSIPVGKILFSVNMVNSTYGWAVGSDGIIIHWDGTSWSNVASPTGAWLSCVDMLGSTDGWIVGADGVYRWQEVTGFPTDYLVFIMVIIVVVAVSLLVYFKKHKRGVGQE